MSKDKRLRNVLATTAFSGIIYLIKWQLGFEIMIIVVLSAFFYTYSEESK